VVYHAYGYVKKAAAIVNESLGKLAKDNVRQNHYLRKISATS
jgi:fumarate hydratase class II